MSFVSIGRCTNLTSAQFWFAECHRYGAGTKIEISEAVRLYKLAAAQRYDQAQVHLDHLFKQNLGVDHEIDFATASQRVTELNTAEANPNWDCAVWLASAQIRRARKPVVCFD